MTETPLRTYVLDTSVLLSDPWACTRFAEHEVVVPLAAVAGAAVRWRWSWPPGFYLILTAADLRAFEGVAGAAGLALDHPAELALRLRGADRALAAEFATELELALAERDLANVEQAAQLGEEHARELRAGTMDRTPVRVHREPDVQR